MGAAVNIAPPVPYFGGKQRVASKIVAHFPPHSHYVEPYAGGLSVLFAKPVTPMETVNDLDEYIVTFWRVLRDRPDDLERACALTPHSRLEHAESQTLDTADEVEVARRVWVRLTQGRGGQLRATGWRYHVDPAGSSMGMTAYLRGYVARIRPAVERLMRVSLECRPALEIIEKYGQHPDVLLYVDPPYLGETRVGSNDAYRMEMKSSDDHTAMLEALLAARAAVVLSGYRSDLYDTTLAEWQSADIAASTGQGSVWSERVETLWSNRPLAQKPHGLFDLDAS